MREIVVNGEGTRIDVHPGTSLLSVLRGVLGLTGPKEACGRGECGACTVLHGGMPVASCILPVELVDKPVRTIEGIAAEAVTGAQSAASSRRSSPSGMGGWT